MLQKLREILGMLVRVERLEPADVAQPAGGRGGRQWTLARLLWTPELLEQAPEEPSSDRGPRPRRWWEWERLETLPEPAPRASRARGPGLFSIEVLEALPPPPRPSAPPRLKRPGLWHEVLEELPQTPPMQRGRSFLSLLFAIESLDEKRSHTGGR